MAKSLTLTLFVQLVNTFQNESLRTLSQNAKLTIDQKASGMLMCSSLCSSTNYRRGGCKVFCVQAIIALP